MSALRRVRPGWWVLLALLLYAGVVTILLRRSQLEVREMIGRAHV